MANGGETQHQCLQRFSQSLQRNQAWSGRRESNPRSQLGKLMTKSCVQSQIVQSWRAFWIVPACKIGIKTTHL